MEGAMVSSSTGAMNAVLHKLTNLIREDHSLRQELVRMNQLHSLRQELVRMNQLLHKFATREVSDAQVKEWMKQAREVAYDIEDWVDLSIHPPRRYLKRKLDPDAYDIDDRINITIHQGGLGDAPEPEIAEQIQDFIYRIDGAIKRCKAYHLLSKAPNADPSSCTDIGTHPQLLYENKAPLVAIRGVIDDLVDDLKNNGQEKLKVVSIVGNRGLGKTTIAKEVYRTLQRGFQCAAFVRIAGPNQPIRRILDDIYSQVRPGFSEMLAEQQVVNNLRKYLSNKRYFVVIDGIESIRVWKSIKCALPENDCGSKIVAITRNSAVGKSCSSHPNDCMREINVLTEPDSKSLFLRLIFGSEERSPFGLRRAFDGILKICCGKPLEIIVVAGLFSGKSSLLAQPVILEKYISSAVNQFPSLQGMRKILHISYADLPLAVKSCFLYLSVFPENYTVKRDRLIRRWIAEGFIPNRGEGRSWETGELYFDELVRRRLIQPVFDYDDRPMMGCTVHAEIRDFLLCLSSEENFATWDEDIRCMPRDVIRRFSLDCSNQEEDDTLASTTVHISKVRSLTFFGDVQQMSDETLHCLRFLRVLDLEDTENLWNHHLKGIDRLVLLRYLGLGGTRICTLPEEIGELQNLETLDLRRTTHLMNLPASIVRLRKLVHLLLSGHAKVEPSSLREIWKMQELEELSTIVVDSSSSLNSVAEMLNKSKRLSMLGVRWGEYYYRGRDLETTETYRGSVMSFLNEVVKSNLRSLLLQDYPAGDLLDLLLDSWEVPPHHLRRFELTISGRLLGGVPHKIASLVSLTHLCISIDGGETEGLRLLGDLPNLVLLHLDSSDPAPGRCTISGDRFRCLVVFLYTCEFGVRGLQFKAGAMPQLRMLRIEFKARETNSLYGYFDFGIEHLCCLQQVHATINCNDARALEVEAAEAAIRERVYQNPSSPVLELSRRFEGRLKGADESDRRAAESALEATISKHPSTPGVNVQWVEEANRQADSRCSVAWLKCGAGAMPDLRKLKLGFNAHAVDRHGTTIPVGIEHLSGLKEISAKIWGASAEEPHGRSAESALSDAIRMHPGRPNVNIQCVDRMFGGKDDKSSGTQEEEHMALQKQCEIIEQDEVQGPEPMLPASLFPSTTAGAKTDCVTAFPFMSPETSHKKRHKKRKALPKWSRQVRVSSGQDEGLANDGFSWRKYGQKDINILGAKYPRSYFRCTHRNSQGCLATKKVQRTDGDPLLLDVRYRGNHTCTQNTQPAGTETSCVTASSFVSPATLESQVTISDPIQGTTWHKERKASPKSSTQVSTLDDGFTWRKYGQKDIPGDKYPRIYMLSESSSHLPIPEHEKVESKQASDVVEDAMVSSSTGAMSSLLKKHATLMGEEYAKLRGTRKEVMILKDELGAMNALLDKLADMAELNFQMKDWRNQMREMTYDIEDCIDDLMLQFDEDNAKPYYIHQPTAYPEKWDVLQKFILQIQSFMGKGDLGSMVHKTEVQILESSYMATESRLPTVYDKAVGLVGMDGPRDELVRWLMDDEQQDKVACILGPGGLGKTTLAKEVYNKIKGRFGRQVFVPVPQKIDITRLLGNILSQLDHQKERYGWDMEELSDVIRRRLQHQRYLIVLDGVWFVETWKYIQRALPENNLASRIIITTNIRDVAESCVSHSSGFIYHMRHLHPNDSCRLFRSIIFGSERSCPIALEKVGDEILEACGGIPLAIIIIASFLANKPIEVAQWKMVEKRMDPAEKGDLTTEGMKKIFHICYSDLPRHMKSCLLYLSVFPGNHVIRKDRVIWRWIAEGFIPRRGEESSWETGESYFQELICRKLIEPTYDDEEDDDVPTSCKVHGVILEFITSLSNEENFVTTDAKTTYMQHGVIRRLTVSYSNQEEDDAFWPITKDLSKVRSLTFFGDVKRGFPSTLIRMRFLRVLDLEDTWNLGNRHLEGIGRLVLLRYLGLRGTSIDVLPEEIGELHNLETLDLRRTTRLRTLPASIVGLRKLVRLLLSGRVHLPREIWKVQELEELSTIVVDSSSSLDSVAELLIKSKRLRMLDVRWDWRVYNARDRETTETNFRSFLKEVGKSNLQSLLLEGYRLGVLLDILLDSWVLPHHLRRFELTISIPDRGVPPKMASLANLTHLRIVVYEVEAEGLRVLGALPNLILLKLESLVFDAERRLITSRHGFRCLVVFSYKCAGMELEFTPGAMPQLRRLRIEFSATATKDWYGDFDFGIQHLSCLTRVHAAITDFKLPLFSYGAEAVEAAAEAAEAAITEQVSKNPNSPVLELSDGESVRSPSGVS